MIQDFQAFFTSLASQLSWLADDCSTLANVCVSVCVCVCERERERESEGENAGGRCFLAEYAFTIYLFNLLLLLDFHGLYTLL